MPHNKIPNHPIEAAFLLFDQNVRDGLNGVEEMMQNLDSVPDPKQPQTRKNPIPQVPPQPPIAGSMPRII